MEALIFLSALCSAAVFSYALGLSHGGEAARFQYRVGEWAEMPGSRPEDLVVFRDDWRHPLGRKLRVVRGGRL